MTTADNHQHIRETVSRIFEQTRMEHGGARLAPFTAAESRFLQDILVRALAELLPNAGR